MMKKKKMCWILIGIGIILTMIFSIGHNGYDIFCFGIPYIIASIGLPQCIKKGYMYPITVLLIFVTLFNIIYFAFELIDINLLYVWWRLPFQYAIPLVIGTCFQYYYDKNKDKEHSCNS